jgi:ankyrin repeat protein
MSLSCIPDMFESEIHSIRHDVQPLPPNEYPLEEGDAPIHKAAYRGQAAVLLSIIESGTINVNILSTAEFTPLYMAIDGNQAEAVRILLSAGADPALEEYMDSLEPSMNAVDHAAYCGSQHAMAALIGFGVEVTPDALGLSAKNNHVLCMRTMLGKAYSEPSRRKAVRGALPLAAQCWHLEAVELLLTTVENFPDKSDEEDQASLDHALVCLLHDYLCDYDCRWKPGKQPFAIVKQLVIAGADVHVGFRLDDLGGSYDPYSGLQNYMDQPEQVRFFLDNGLRMDHTFDDGRTPLFSIVSNEQADPDSVAAFIEAGAEVRKNDGNLATPLHVATQRSFAEMLFGHGADLFARDAHGITPLHAACRDGHLGVVEFLISKGADLNDVVTEARWTPLLFAVFESEYGDSSKKLQVVKSLITNGANVRAAATDGRTALHGASRRGEAELALYLIEAGADVSAVTADGDTALHYACWNILFDTQATPPSVAEVLIDHGADLEAKDGSGATPLFSSVARHHDGPYFAPHMVNMLLRRGANKLAPNDEGKTVLDLIDPEKWSWNGDGMLRAKPPPPKPFARGRGGGGRGGWRLIR